MRTLLVVDDQPSVRAALTYLFGLHGCEVTCAATGSEALALPIAFEAALVDLHMPGMDGLAVCRGLIEAARATGRALPVWIMTSTPMRTTGAAVTEAGGVGLVRKPFDCGELLAQMDAAAAQALPPAAAFPSFPSPGLVPPKPLPEVGTSDLRSERIPA